MEENMNLYLLKNGLNKPFYVIAGSPNQAQNKLQRLLDEADYGYSKDRKVKSIELLGEEVTNSFNGKPFFCGEGNLILPSSCQ